jgi:peptidoglycan/LPS O-acetylase OafA/YrhL
MLGVAGSAPDRHERSTFRRDVEGLRAVAVALVVLSHLTGWPRGGFVGVDVFFVISGFLITGLLLDETERDGRLSFRRFYARRARRILPVAISVLTAVVVAAHVVFRGARVAQTVTDVKWALGFSANVHFARTGTDYFQADRPPSLVQHFWSLAVEEQFYLAWPLAVLLVLALPAGRPARLRALLAVVGAASVTSFVLAVLHTRDTPTSAYFSSLDRAWELGVGAFAAVAAAAFPNLPMRLGRGRRPVWLAGLAGIAMSGLLVPSAPGFPAPWGVVPVASTSALVVAGIDAPIGTWGLALTNPVSRYVGRISYSLYLWHWPVILLVAALVPRPWALRYPIAVLAMLGLAIASFHFVEVPLRRMRFGRPGRQARLRLLARARRPALAAVGCLAAAAVLSVLVPGRAAPSFATAAAAAPPGLTDAGPAVAKPHRSLAAAIDKALAATDFPRFDPPVGRLGSARTHWGACDGATGENLARCAFGSNDPHARVAVVIGDSVAMSWLPGVEAALSDRAWRIYGLTLEACPAADLPVRAVQGGHDADCDRRHAWVRTEAARLNPQLAILASTDDTLSRMGDGSGGARASAEYQAALQRTITTLHPGPRRHVLTLSPPPLANDLATCDTAGSAPAGCVRQISARWISFARAEAAAAAATHTSYSDTHLWFCNRAGYCPAFVGTTLVRWDGQHVTDVYARELAGEIRRVVEGATRGQT